MVNQDISRKLAVIVHADVAGSTALVQRDETRAHKRITEAFQRFSSIIKTIVAPYARFVGMLWSLILPERLMLYAPLLTSNMHTKNTY